MRFSDGGPVGESGASPAPAMRLTIIVERALRARGIWDSQPSTTLNRVFPASRGLLALLLVWPAVVAIVLGATLLDAIVAGIEA